MYETVLGLNYTKTLSKEYPKVKELMKKAMLKYTTFKLKDVATLLRKDIGIKDCNYFTILIAMQEIVEECKTEGISLNVDVLDIEIQTHDLPF